MDFVVVAGEKGGEAGHEGFDVTALDVADELNHGEIALNEGRSIELAQ